jgi:metal-responsive CopG/Arc/MetJ family transcriptional regulator
MSARKLAISLEDDLAKEVQRAARAEARGNVSAWLAEAARQRLRQVAARQALKMFEAENGEITETELRRARRSWPRG